MYSLRTVVCITQTILMNFKPLCDAMQVVITHQEKSLIKFH